MKKIKLMLSLLLLSIAFYGYGQNYALKVLVSMGENQVRKATGDWEKLKTGASLVSTDLIKIPKGGYLGFVHYSGYALEWKKEGTFPVSQIESNVVTTSSLVSKYADFLISKSANGEHSGNVAGGVHRGSEGAIQLLAPVNAMVMNEAIDLFWIGQEGKDYKVVVKNLYDGVLINTPTSGNRIKIDFSSSEIGKEKTILVQIFDQADEDSYSQQIAIVKLDDKQRKNLSKVFKDLSEGIDQESALGQYLMAGFYEESKLILDALNSMQKAVKLAPDVDFFTEAYQEFLLRNQLN